MIIPVIRRILPAKIKVIVLKGFEYHLTRKILIKLQDFDTWFGKILFSKKDFYEFQFRDKTVVGNIKFAMGTNDDKIYDVIKVIINSSNKENYSPPILLDIGANIGLTSIVMSEFVTKDAKIYSFEPGSQKKYLNENLRLLKLDSKVKLVDKAVHSNNSDLTLYTYDESIVDSRTYLDSNWTDRDQTRIKREKVKAITVDQFLSTNQLRPEQLQLIKIDCQGSEPNIFLGMFANCMPPVNVSIISEFWPYALEQQNHDPSEFLNSLIKKFEGFNVYYFTRDSKITKLDNDLETFNKSLGFSENEFCDLIFTKLKLV